MKTGFLKSKKLAGGLGLLLALVLLVGLSMPVAGAVPLPAHEFRGNANICGTPVPADTVVTARIQGTALTWTVMTDASGDFLGLNVPGDSGPPKDGGEDGDIIEIEVMGQVLYSTAWVTAQTNGGETSPTGPPWYVPLDLVVQPTLTTSSTTGGSVTAPVVNPYQATCGEVVPIVATPDTDYVFDEWTGHTDDIANVNNASTTIEMNGNYMIVAEFVPTGITYTLDITIVGDGTTMPPGGVTHTYPAGTPVTLTPTPGTDYTFDGWSGPDVGQIVGVVITMNGDYNITATFVPITYTLDITIVGDGTTMPPGGVTHTYPAGTPVTLTATPGTGNTFDGWSGPDVGQIIGVVITMNGDYNITATFVPEDTYALTTSSTHGGSVTTPAVSPYYVPYDTMDVPIVATAANDCYVFDKWTGDTGEITNVNDASTTIDMTGDYTIVAEFKVAGDLEELEIPFDVGWNTFSTPVSLHDCVNTWGEFLAVNGLGLSIDMIYGYNGDWVPVFDGDEIEPLYGFYVKASEAGMAYIIPNTEKTSLPARELSSGVSLIGPAPASLGDIDVVSALITLYYAEAMGGDPPLQPWGYTQVVSPPVNSPNDWAYVRNEPAPDPLPTDWPPLMNSGRAYWVVVENADEYVGQSSTGEE